MQSLASARIRPARLSDVPELVAMMATFNRGEKIVWRSRLVLPALRRLLRDARLGRVIVAEGAGQRRLNGYAVATFGYDLEYAGRDAFLTELFVRPGRRGTGLGRHLLQAITEVMRDAGVRAFHLAVWPSNRCARRLYQTSGFSPIPRLFLSKRLERAR